MRPQTIGRVLGVGVRIAGRMVGERLAESANAAPPARSQAIVNAGVHAENARQAVRASAQAGAGMARGVGGFLRPFGRVGRILWLEITGAFFFLPVIAFAPNLWRMRASWAHGPDHRMFLITAAVVLVFLYLGISSFWRARRR